MDPNHEQKRYARKVVTNPALFLHKPTKLQNAWATLKEAQGNPVDFNRLGPALYHLHSKKTPVNQVIAELSSAPLNAPTVNPIDAARLAAIPLIPLIRRTIADRRSKGRAL